MRARGRARPRARARAQGPPRGSVGAGGAAVPGLPLRGSMLGRRAPPSTSTWAFLPYPSPVCCVAPSGARSDSMRAGSAGIELVLTILILGGLGRWLDTRYWGGRGWGSGAGFLLGVAVAFRNLMRTAAHMQRD